LRIDYQFKSDFDLDRGDLSMNVSRALPAGGRRASILGVAAPLLCAVHCVAAPLLVVVSPALVHGPAETAFRLATLAIAALLLRSGLRAHGRRVVLAPAALGVAAWALSEAAPSAETALSVAGGLLIATGMLWNARLRHRAVCHSCGCPAHGHED
jgi:hypothetical protein